MDKKQDYAHLLTHRQEADGSLTFLKKSIFLELVCSMDLICSLTNKKQDYTHFLMHGQEFENSFTL